MARTANPIDVERTSHRVESFEFDVPDQCRHRGSHLLHLSTHRANLMTMIVAVEASLKLRTLLKGVPHHQPYLHEQVDGIVESGLAHPEVVSLHFGPQLFQGEMSVDMIYGIEYGIAFWGFSALVLLQI